MTRQDLLSRTFVELADTLVENYDQIEFLHRLAERCVSLLGVAEAGVVLVGSEGQLRPLASSSERMHLIELIEVQSQDGPCLDCWRSGEAVREDRLAEAQARAGRASPRQPWVLVSFLCTPSRCASARSVSVPLTSSPTRLTA